MNRWIIFSFFFLSLLTVNAALQLPQPQPQPVNEGIYFAIPSANSLSWYNPNNWTPKWQQSAPSDKLQADKTANYLYHLDWSGTIASFTLNNNAVFKLQSKEAKKYQLKLTDLNIENGILHLQTNADLVPSKTKLGSAGIINIQEDSAEPNLGHLNIAEGGILNILVPKSMGGQVDAKKKVTISSLSGKGTIQCHENPKQANRHYTGTLIVKHPSQFGITPKNAVFSGTLANGKKR